MISHWLWLISNMSHLYLIRPAINPLDWLYHQLEVFTGSSDQKSSIIDPLQCNNTLQFIESVICDAAAAHFDIRSHTYIQKKKETFFKEIERKKKEQI